MRTVCTVLTLAAALAVAPRFFADEKTQGQPNGEGEGSIARIQDLNLTDEQEAKIADIRKEARPKVEETAKELATLIKEEVDKVRQVLTPDQIQKLQAMRDERKEQRMEGLAERLAHLHEMDLTDAEVAQIQEIRKEFHPKIAKALEGLRGVLNDDQKKSREEALKAGKSHAAVLGSLNLTDDQKEKIKAIGKEVCPLVHDEMDKIRDVLSAEQQEKLGELKDERRDRARDRMASAIANFRDLGLTEEQKTQIAAIRTEYRPKIHEAGNKLRAAVREEIGAVAAVVKGS